MDLSELETLGPEERIKQIQELEITKRTEIQVLHQLLAEALAELNIKLEKQRLPIDQLKSAHISNLVSEEEREMFRLKQFVVKAKQTGEEGVADADTSNPAQPIPVGLSRAEEKLLEQTVMEEQPFRRQRRKSSTSQSSASFSEEYQAREEAVIPQYDKTLSSASASASSFYQSQQSQSSHVMFIQGIIALTDLDYRLGKEERLSEKDLSEFYKIKKDFETARQQEFVGVNEQLQCQIDIGEKLINKIRYNL
ncbi:hypothetical protein HYS47_03110 [Candidatus Woesearchaeota archaeon]|nr:hypothetical protein [Candidatus Woesearchaeota archaeon]